MSAAIDYSDPRYAELARAILRRHETGAAEANITSAVRDFLTNTGLAKAEEIVEENPPSEGSRKAVDLTALDTFIEFKRRIGPTPGGEPYPEHVQQLDDYLAESEVGDKRVRMGVLTDGKYWLLRWPGAGPVTTPYPYSFTLESADRWPNLYFWLRDKALLPPTQQPPDRDGIAQYLGPGSPAFERDIGALERLYGSAATRETVVVKRQLWGTLLVAALGEEAGNPGQQDLFVRHTYLSMTIGMIVQASFGTDISRLAETDPADLLHGRHFHNATSLHGIVESDFFAWPAEFEGGKVLIRALARRIARFDWASAPADIGAILYETVIPAAERRRLGEYYTPSWLARVMVRELVTDPLRQRVLDPTCGSGTFLVEAINHFLAAATKTGLEAKEAVERLRVSVIGIDVHPVAVHLARAAWILAARPAIVAAAKAGYNDPIAVPVYLGDALQLRFSAGDLFAEHQVRIEVEDEQNTSLTFPVSLVERPDTFDPLMGDIAAAIERGNDPSIALADHDIPESERGPMRETIEAMQRLHAQGRNHIWAYYTRNLVRPVALSRSKVDVIIGNPPWLTYNKTVSTLRTTLERHSKEIYDIWGGGRYATHQDVAGLFFTRSVALYLKDDGVIGMVMPHSVLQSGQYAKWRKGSWQAGPNVRGVAVCLDYKPAWDLEGLKPNNFFPVPAAVVFARRTAKATPLAGRVERWLGAPGAADVERVEGVITDTSAGGASPYAGRSRQGATIVPRRLFFVQEIENPASFVPGQTITVTPRRGSQDKEPWRSLDLTAIERQSVGVQYVFDIHLGETIVPYAVLDPLTVILPVRRGDAALPVDKGGVGGVSLARLEPAMRDRWSAISAMWDGNKAAATKSDLLGQLDYYGKLSSQLEWRQDTRRQPIRLVYSSSGRPTAALLHDDYAVVDYTLFWTVCTDAQEAHYLLGIINSQALYESVKPLMPKGQFGARHLQMHLWRLPIPEFDAGDPLHATIAQAGQTAAEGAAEQLAALRTERDHLTTAFARRRLRAWLRDSPEGGAVEDAVARLLGSA